MNVIASSKFAVKLRRTFIEKYVLVQVIFNIFTFLKVHVLFDQCKIKMKEKLID